MFYELDVDYSKKYLLAYSGGVDSTALAHLLVTKYRVNLRLLHIDTGSQNRPDRNRHSCINNFAKLLGVPIDIIYSNQKYKTDLLVHRAIKYSAMTKLMDSNTIALTAHHLEDQINTMLIKLSRSNSPSNWVIEEWRPLGAGKLWRPLLGISKQALIKYVADNKLSYFADKDNFNLSFKRNLLNIKVLPSLLSIGSITAFERSLSMLKDHNQIVAYTVKNTYIKVKSGNKIDTNMLLKEPQFLYGDVVHYWLQKEYFVYPSGKILNKILLSIKKVARDPRAVLYVSLSRTRCVIIDIASIKLMLTYK